MKTNKKENRFYVYVYLDPRKPGKYIYGDYSFDYEPFYVGKGYGSRQKEHLKPSLLKKNSPKNNKIKKIIQETSNNPTIITLEKKISEIDALNLEKNIISIIGRKNLNKGPLTNLTDGGEGEIGRTVSEKTRKKISKSLSGNKNPNYGKKGKDSKAYGYKHTDEAKRKISKNNSKYWLGKKKSKETKNKISISKKGTKMHKNTFNALRKYRNENPQYNIKTWKLISPDGEIFIISNGLQKFADKNNLMRSKLVLVAQGKRNHHKGWKCEYA